MPFHHNPAVRLLFLGGTGNISAECASLLHDQGHSINVLSRGQSTVPSEYRVIKADRRDPGALRAALGAERFDVVLDFIAYELQDVQRTCEVFDGRIQQ